MRFALSARLAPWLALGLVAAASWSAPSLGAEPPSETAAAPESPPADAPKTPPTGVESTAAKTLDPAAEDDPTKRPARPELAPGMEPPPAPEWERRLDIGLGAAYVARPLMHERAASAGSYQPSVGIDIHLRWDVVSFLRFKPYYYWVQHNLSLPQGALGSSPNGLSHSAVMPEVRADTFAFGAQLEPTWWLNERLRVWLAAGVGWGRLYVPDMQVEDPVRGAVPIVNRSMVFVEFPLALGVSVDVIERWLALELEVRATPLAGQSGDALDTAQAVDAAGQLVDVGPLEAPDVTFVQTLGLALIL